jgi:DNA-binding response OmpR family regulator/phosphoribosyl 1,2-cyclic phosphodiesterase
LHGHILISHTHWDHIQGIPFFEPLFEPKNEWDIYAPRGMGQDLKQTLAGQMQYTYFPVTLDRLGATIRYHELVEGTFGVGDIRVRAQYLNHPALTLGYRLEADNVVIVYASDHEPHSRVPAAAGQTSDADSLAPGDERHADFLADADLVIHDAQYTSAEYLTKRGWGHSPLEYVVDRALASRVKRLALFHHDPLRDDAVLDRLTQAGRDRVTQHGEAMEVFAAAEGQCIELEAALATDSERVEPDALELSGVSHAVVGHTVVVAVADMKTAVLLAEAIRSDELRLLPAESGEAVLQLVRSERPTLLIIDTNLPGGDGVEVCRAVRREADADARGVPVVLVAETEDRLEAARGAEAGVTDWLIQPFSSEYARTKIRAWLLRSRSRWMKGPLPANERERIWALRRLNILDTPPEERFDRLTRLARRLFEVPIALVSLVDSERQWFKSCQGLAVRETPREVAFCAHAILSLDALVVSDALKDERFADNPIVTGEPHVRFYAGQPLAAPDGSRVGTLCIIDHRPRELSESDLEALRDLAALVEQELHAGALR